IAVAGGKFDVGIRLSSDPQRDGRGIEAQAEPLDIPVLGLLQHLTGPERAHDSRAFGVAAAIWIFGSEPDAVIIADVAGAEQPQGAATGEAGKRVKVARPEIRVLHRGGEWRKPQSKM